MKLINAALKKKNLKLNQLPDELQSRIEGVQQMILKFNEAYDAYEDSEEKDDEDKVALDEQEHAIAEEETDVANEIKEFDLASYQQQISAQAQAQSQAQAEGEKKEKEDSGIGWLVFGAVVLVGTLGLVNVLKKK
jgi:hypothetical protein